LHDLIGVSAIDTGVNQQRTEYLGGEIRGSQRVVRDFC